jgi:hypothetical protein
MSCAVMPSAVETVLMKAFYALFDDLSNCHKDDFPTIQVILTKMKDIVDHLVLVKEPKMDKEVTAKEVPAKKVPAKKVSGESAKKVPAKKVPAKKVPAKKVKKVSIVAEPDVKEFIVDEPTEAESSGISDCWEAVAKSVPPDVPECWEALTEEDHTEEDHTEGDLLEEDPVEEDPAEEDPAEEDPTEEDPTEEDPVEEDPVEEDPVEEDPIEEDALEEPVAQPIMPSTWTKPVRVNQVGKQGKIVVINGRRCMAESVGPTVRLTPVDHHTLEQWEDAKRTYMNGRDSKSPPIKYNNGNHTILIGGVSQVFNWTQRGCAILPKAIFEDAQRQGVSIFVTRENPKDCKCTFVAKSDLAKRAVPDLKARLLAYIAAACRK